MATSFPTALDTFTNPVGTDRVDTVGPHHTEHANDNDSIAALEAKVGIDNSAVTTSIDYRLGGPSGGKVALLGAANTFTVGPQLLKTGASTNVGLIVQSVANQTTDSMEWQNNLSAVLARTSTPSGTGPFHLIVGGAAFTDTGAGGVGGSFGMGRNVYYDGTNFRRLIANNPVGFLQLDSGGGAQFYTATDAGATADSIITLTQRFRIESGGSTVCLPGAGAIGIISRLSSGTTDLQQWQDASSAAHMAVTSTALLKWTATGDQQTTVGAAGGASALPATPTKYMKIVDSAGTTLVIPAYAVA